MNPARYRLVQEDHQGTLDRDGERLRFYWAVYQGARLVFRTQLYRDGEELVGRLNARLQGARRRLGVAA